MTIHISYFSAFFRLTFWELGWYTYVSQELLEKTVNGNQKPIFRMHQTRPKQVILKLFHDNFVISYFFAFFGPKFWATCWCTCAFQELLEKTLRGWKKGISGMHQIRQKQVKLKLIFYDSCEISDFPAFFRLKFWENMAIYLCFPGVIRKTVCGNQKRIFRMHQIRPKETRNLNYFLWQFWNFIFFGPFQVNILRIMVIYLCLPGVFRKKL